MILHVYINGASVDAFHILFFELLLGLKEKPQKGQALTDYLEEG